MATENAPERLWVQLTPSGGTVSYIRDPREAHDNGRPVYEYVRATPSVSNQGTDSGDEAQPPAVPSSRSKATSKLDATWSPYTECCADWKPQTSKLDAPIRLAQARNPDLTSTAEFQFKAWVFCPWCGTRRASVPPVSHDALEAELAEIEASLADQSDPWVFIASATVSVNRLIELLRFQVAATDHWKGLAIRKDCQRESEYAFQAAADMSREIIARLEAELLRSRISVDRDGARLWGELFIDENGEAHFVCHTQDADFAATRTAFFQFIGLLVRQIVNQQECPFAMPPVSKNANNLADALNLVCMELDDLRRTPPVDRDAVLDEAAGVAINAGTKAYRNRLGASANNRYAQEQVIRRDVADSIAKAIRALKGSVKTDQG